MRGTSIAVATLAVTLAACSPVAEGSATGPTTTTAPPSATVAPEPVPTTTPAEAAGRVPVRSCGSHVVGDITGWRRDATIVGPVGWWGLRGYAAAPDRSFRSVGPRYPTLKAVMIVAAGSPVSVRVLQPDLARLMYDPGAWTSQRRYRLEQGAAEMVFEPCDGTRWTQFNGSWLVTGRVCVTVEVRVEGRGPERLEVPLGRPCG